MVSASTNIANIQQDFMNNITQQDQQNCIATFTNEANDNITIINGGTISGDIIGVQLTANTDASCLITSNMEDSISNILSATLSQTNSTSTDLFNGFQFTADTNIFNIEQSVVNNISQINEATCSASTTNSTNNNYLYATNVRSGGNFIGVNPKANASSNCSLNNVMKNATYNQAQASATQSNQITGMFTALLAVIAGIIGIMIIGTLILYSTGAIGKVGYQRGGAPGEQLSPEDRELREAADLGLTPEDLQLLLQPQTAAA